MPTIVFPEFRDATNAVKYPFLDTATLTDTLEQIVLPNDIFIDLSIYAPGATTYSYLESITVNNDTVRLQFNCGTSVERNKRAYCTLNTLESAENKDITVPLYNTVTKSMRVGTLVINDLKLAYFKGLPVGTYAFSEDATNIVPSCILTMPDIGVKSISVNTKSDDSTVTGVVWLIGHDGVFLRTGKNPSEIRIDVVGDSLYKKAALGVDKYEIARPVRTINGRPADEFGNFNISTTSVYDAIRIENRKTGIDIYMAGAINGD